ncbi:protein EMSY-LIKE 1 [Eutrema salsugineum]|uniref:protein EMSY-LIKE 1 n=1 Tax=Eutrema salsugineum TaxID=72664 RepID=UPI000CED1857|nr:protein EMSY-LIKE 1 [Eutrema salsugineum]
MAEKSVAGYNNRVPESKPDPDSESESESESSDSDSDDYDDDDDDEDGMYLLGEDYSKNTLVELKKKALYSVLRAFRAETSTTTNKRTQIIENLMNQWNIAEETLVSLEDNIQKELFAQQQRVDSSAPDNKGIVKPKPRTIFEEKKETLIPTSVDRFGSGWGSVDPESLIGKLVSVRMPGEDRFEEFTIQIYDAQQEMHRLEPVYVESDAMKIDEMLNWVDLREIPPEEIMWEGGERPNFDSTYDCFPRR